MGIDASPIFAFGTLQDADDEGRFQAGSERWSLPRWQRTGKSAFLDDVVRRMSGYDASRPARRSR